uniref:endo-polygalacturonase n=2 Tax=Dendroctonus ponderosae TaxID=77166 RepID=J3JTP5_DENPD|nr:unknown [Dendroctonus ponderosae]
MSCFVAVVVLAAFFQNSLSQTCLVTDFEQVLEATRTCKDISIENLSVPGGQTLKLNLTDGSTVTFKGRTVFEFTTYWKGPLVTINGTSVTIQGVEGHIFDGQGRYYWDGLGDKGVPKPQFFTVQTFGGSIMRDIYVLNSPHDVLQVTNSDRVEFYNWRINDTAGDEDPTGEGKFGKNTDGIDVWNSTNVLIRDVAVFNQDDCVAVRCGANISVSNVLCYNTHGLSLSVGFNNDTSSINPLNTLKNVTFFNASMHGDENAIHIKTHNEGGLGFIEDVLYENIQLSGATHYGILIEQNYPLHTEPSDNVPIKNLNILDVYGEVESDAVAVQVVCAEEGCEDWFWDDIDIWGSSKENSCNYKPSGSFLC